MAFSHSPAATGIAVHVATRRSPFIGTAGRPRRFLHDWSLALIGNASGRILWGWKQKSTRGVFDKETRRKPLAFAADGVRYGI